MVHPPERIDIHLYVHLDQPEDKVTSKLNKILLKLTQMEKHMTKEFDDLEAEVSENTSVVGSFDVVLAAIKDRLDKAIASGNDPAALKRLSTALGANNEKIGQWIITNTVAEDETADPAAA